MFLSVALSMIFVISFVLLYFNWWHKPTTLYISLSMVLLVLMVGTVDLFNSGQSIFWLAFFYNHFTPFYLLIGPFLFFYVRGTLTDIHRIRRSDLWHFIPFLFQLVAIIPYLIQPWSFKLEVAEVIARDYRDVARMPGLRVYPPVWLRTSFRAVSWIAYTTCCLIWVYRFRRNYPSKYRIPFRKALPVLRFMQYFLSVHFIISVLFSVFFFRYIMDVYGAKAPFMSDPLRAAFIISLSAIPIMVLFSPEMLYGIPRLVRPNAAVSSVPSIPDLTQPSTDEEGDESDILEPEEGDVSTDRFVPMASLILSVLEERKLYLDPDFNLDDLSQVMAVPKHHLYYCFNVILQTSFTRLRTECRVRHAQGILRDQSSLDVTLNSIGLSSGFSSPTAFRKAFRDVAGMSPRDFQRSVTVTGE